MRRPFVTYSLHPIPSLYIWGKFFSFLTVQNMSSSCRFFLVVICTYYCCTCKSRVKRTGSYNGLVPSKHARVDLNLDTPLMNISGGLWFHLAGWMRIFYADIFDRWPVLKFDMGIIKRKIWAGIEYNENNAKKFTQESYRPKTLAHSNKSKKLHFSVAFLLITFRMPLCKYVNGLEISIKFCVFWYPYWIFVK